MTPYHRLQPDVASSRRIWFRLALARVHLDRCGFACCAGPVALDLGIDRRLPDAPEAAAYYVVAESW